MSEEEIIDKVMMIDQWKISGDIYTQGELNAIGELIDLYNKEKEKNKELKKENLELHKEINQRIKLKLENERCADKDFIPKSKVKELLEHYKNTGYNELEEVLQELLEEGE